jgi:hypothetical protein
LGFKLGRWLVRVLGRAIGYSDWSFMFLFGPFRQISEENLEYTQQSLISKCLFIHDPSDTLSFHASIVCVWINVVKYTKTTERVLLTKQNHVREIACVRTNRVLHIWTQSTHYIRCAENSDRNISANLALKSPN